MRIARVIVVGSDVVGFQCLLDGLVTEEGHIELMASLVQVLGRADVLVYVVEPLLDDVFVCHIVVVLLIGCKYTTISREKRNFF